MIFVMIMSVVFSDVYETFVELRRIRKVISCDDLPAIERVNSALEELKMKGVLDEYLYFQNSVHSEIGIDTERCPGKADIRIDYETSFDRARIKNLIKNIFTNIPHRMMNR